MLSLLLHLSNTIRDDVFESVDYEDEGRAKRGCSRGQGGKKKQSPGGTAKSTARESQRYACLLFPIKFLNPFPS